MTLFAHPETDCPSERIISSFVDEQQVILNGFHFQVTPPGGSYTFQAEGEQRYLSLRMAPFAFKGELSASRISEIDTSRPLAQRVYCWQPIPTADVVVQYTHRFQEAAPPPGLSENLFLWNARLAAAEGVTAVGVTRSHLYNGYFAILAQDFHLAANTGLLQLCSMPAWLDPTAWHTIHLALSSEFVTIQAAQGDEQAVVLHAAWLHPPAPLGFEFSVDNEIAPGSIVPVTVADQLDVAFFSAAMRPTG